MKLYLLLLLALLLSACDSRLDERLAATRVQQVEGSFDETFARAEHVELYPGQQPSLIYSGKDSTVIVRSEATAVTKRNTGSSFIFSSRKVDVVTVRGLARTINGRFFSFSYYCEIDPVEPCTQEGLRINPMGLERAKSWLWHDEQLFSAQLYRDTFDEEPAPHKIAA